MANVNADLIIELLYDIFEDFRNRGVSEIDDDLREECLVSLEDGYNDDRDEHLAGSQMDIIDEIIDLIDNRHFIQATDMMKYLVEQEKALDDTEYRVWLRPNPENPADIIPIDDDDIDKGYLIFLQRKGK